jgi:hypothetical protein
VEPEGSPLFYPPEPRGAGWLMGRKPTEMRCASRNWGSPPFVFIVHGHSEVVPVKSSPHIPENRIGFRLVSQVKELGKLEVEKRPEPQRKQVEDNKKAEEGVDWYRRKPLPAPAR